VGSFWRTWHAESITTAWKNLRRSLVKATSEIPLETEHAATAEWPESLKACVEA